MAEAVHKVAILHRDVDIIARVTRLAAAAGLDVLRPVSLAAFARQINDPLLSAIVTELPAPRDGGIDALERMRSPTSSAAIIVITDADDKTLESASRAAAAKGLAVTMLRTQSINDADLTRQLCGGRNRSPDFGPADIEDCIENQHLRVEYQPKVSLLSSSPSSQFGVEALCRIRDPRFGAVSPDKFIPMAEKCGLIGKLSDAVACHAFRAWQSWKASGLCLRLALNVSPALLGDEEWSDRFLQRCAEFAMEPKWITLEITETAAGATDPRACEILTKFQKKGFALSIDDFGTGFSSLATLYRLPISEMKIDKSFIFDLQVTAGARSLIESAVSMAKRMGIKVVAEGVESESVFHELRKMGCHEVQGFFVGKSMPAEAVVPFFTGWRKTMQDAPAAGTAGLPKVAVLQALLNQIMSDQSLEPAVPVPAGPYGAPMRKIETVDGSKDLVRRIPPLALEGKTLPALALCHDALRQLQKVPARKEMSDKVAQLQAHLERELTSSADLELYTARRTFRLLPRDAVTLGRPSASTRVDIPIKCRWFSNGEKNLRLFTKSGQWFLEDLGSTHGHYIDEDRLTTQRPFEIPQGRTLVEVRLASGAVAPLSLLFERPALNPQAMTISFEYDAVGLRADLGERDWAEIESDLSCTWVVFSGKLDAGNSSNCALILEDSVSPMAATIRFDNGYWIAPQTSAGLAIDDTIFHQDVPLPVKSELNLGDCLLVVREADRENAMASVSKTAPSNAYGQKLRLA